MGIGDQMEDEITHETQALRLADGAAVVERATAMRMITQIQPPLTGEDE
jgi:hypothetical protein